MQDRYARPLHRTVTQGGLAATLDRYTGPLHGGIEGIVAVAAGAREGLVACSARQRTLHTFRYMIVCLAAR